MIGNPVAIASTTSRIAQFGTSKTTKGSFNTGEPDFSSLGNALELRIELNRSLEMFFGQLVHSEIFQPEAEHPMIKRIIWSELIGLFFVRNGFVDSAQRSLGAGELIAD